MTTDQLIAAVSVALIIVAGFAGLYAGFHLGVKHERDHGTEYFRGRRHGWGDGLRDASSLVRVIRREGPNLCPRCIADEMDRRANDHLDRARRAAEADAAKAKAAIDGQSV